MLDTFFWKMWYINKYLISNENLINICTNGSWDNKNNILFIFFYLIIILSTLGVIFSKNPVHSVLFLILVFINISLLLLLLNVEFIAFLILIVYLGAIAVLFLFVIMMFNINVLETKDNIIRYIPLVVIIIIIICKICYINIKNIDYIILKKKYIYIYELFFNIKNWYNIKNSKENIEAISIIYNYYIILFILAGIILLVAMIGAIFLTLNQEIDLKKQKYNEQNKKTLQNTIMLKQWVTEKNEIWILHTKERQENKKNDKKDRE